MLSTIGSRGRGLTLVLAAAALAACAQTTPSADSTVSPAASAASDVLAGDTLPLRYRPRPTTTAITPADLMSRVYLFADDSMGGRRAGFVTETKATAYLAAELARMGATPAGDSGTFFQRIPLVRRVIDSASTIVVDGTPLVLWRDFGATRPQRIYRRSLDGVQAIYGGTFSQDSSALPTREEVAGKLVVFTFPPPPAGNPPPLPLIVFQNHPRLAGAAAVALVGWEHASPPLVGFLRSPSFALRSEAPPGSGPVTLYLTTDAATRILGAAPASFQRGAAGRTVRGALVLSETPTAARNVVAVIPGSDPALRGQYVALGAHSDHIGLRAAPVDHDSLRAVNAMVERFRAQNGGREPTAADREGFRVDIDSLRRIRPARLDSINNGADDDASGSMGVLEVAEYFAAPANRPKRSLLFVWHTAEEAGLLGAQWYTDHPTVPRDSIVTQLNVDMIGRGMAGDLPEGKPGYIQLLGSRRLSTELGDLVEEVGSAGPVPFTFDYQFDAAGHPEQYYCRSDHYMYARYGIPVVFLSTGDHRDYHQVTDESQYINYAQLARVSTFLKDLAVRVGNLDHAPVVDKPKPDPKGQCRQ